MISKWETLSETQVADLKIFRAKSVERLNPVSMQRGFFTVLDSPDWVNIIPITDDGSIVFVKQYRHGSDSVSLELPGGLKEKNESALEAAKRECTEETGYISAGEPIQIGVSLPNPAFLTNKCTSFVWLDCKKLYGQQLDSHEVIDVVTVPISEIRNLILSGELNHSVILTALFYYSLKYGL